MPDAEPAARLAASSSELTPAEWSRRTYYRWSESVRSSEETGSNCYSACTIPPRLPPLRRRPSWNSSAALRNQSFRRVLENARNAIIERERRRIALAGMLPSQTKR